MKNKQTQKEETIDDLVELLNSSLKISPEKKPITKDNEDLIKLFDIICAHAIAIATNDNGSFVVNSTNLQEEFALLRKLGCENKVINKRYPLIDFIYRLADEFNNKTSPDKFKKGLEILQESQERGKRFNNYVSSASGYTGTNNEILGSTVLENYIPNPSTSSTHTIGGFVSSQSRQ